MATEEEMNRGKRGEGRREGGGKGEGEGVEDRCCSFLTHEQARKVYLEHVLSTNP